MIARLAAALRPATPVIAGLLILVGSRMLATYTAAQRVELTQAAADLGALGLHIQQLRAQVADLPDPADVYPAREDVDPLARAADDDELRLAQAGY